LKGIENIFTQHKPFLSEILVQILNKKLDERDFPVAAAPSITPTSNSTVPPQNRPPYEKERKKEKNRNKEEKKRNKQTCTNKHV